MYSYRVGRRDGKVFRLTDLNMSALSQWELLCALGLLKSSASHSKEELLFFSGILVLDGRVFSFRLPLMWLLWTYCQNEAFLLQGALHHLRKWGPHQNQPHLAELGKYNPCIRISKLTTLQTESNCLKCLSTGRNISTRLCFLQLNPMIDHTISLRKNPSISLKQFLLR